MANEDANDISSLYPSPPPYIKFFSQENVDKLEEYKQNNEQEIDDNGNEVMNSELDFLIPPPMPKSHQYRAFGSVWNVKDQLPDLESMGLTQLYKKNEPVTEAVDYQYKIQELRKMLKSLLLNYLELVGILSINPEKFPEKVENIKTILVNIHHLLNAYRPHQSRESLIMLLEEQLEYKKMEIKQYEDVCEQVREKLQQIRNIDI